MIFIKKNDDIERMREPARIVAEARELASRLVQPGISTGELDRKIEELIRSRDAEPSFKGYRGYPKASCISVNNQVVHGIPGDLVLEDGDLVSVDIGAYKNGFHGDGAMTYAVGEIHPAARKLLDVTRDSLRLAIVAATPGARVGAIGSAVQQCAEAHGYGIVRDLVGHGIGRNLHEDPQIPNYGRAGQGPRLRPGMVLAIEPMLNAGTHEIETLEDGWTIVTKDGRLSAHFEETVAVTESGPEVLTKL